MSKPKPRPAGHDPWLPAAYDKYDVAALQALATGTANEHQQQRALKWIVETACGTYDLPWQPGGPDGARATDFANGKRFVGLQVVKLTRLILPNIPD